MASFLKVVIVCLVGVPLICAETPQRVPWQPFTFSSGPASPLPPIPGFPAGYPFPYAFPGGFPYNPAYFWQLLAQYNAALNSAVSNSAAATLANIAAVQEYASRFPYRTLDAYQQQPVTTAL